ncbi:TolB-like translocation protein [Anaeromyxobacter oryzisoli]|uniref:hypothetical protein n=1 Tax=Anaeromyxobacter oryzisoli TaxID=2925408 RepID=UPI001F5722FB|nr:hypothetical protein [Anaeromyxobacter sp. SG63]
MKNPPPGKELVTWLASWSKAKDRPEMVKLFGNNRCGDFRFSPDGKWVVFADSSEGANALMVMPVDPSLPHLFGPPILLKSSEEMPDDWNGNCAWISDPLSVVCNVQKTVTSKLTDEESQESKLLKWELSSANVKK